VVLRESIIVYLLDRALVEEKLLKENAGLMDYWTFGAEFQLSLL
jgi:hypothetical protein